MNLNYIRYALEISRCGSINRAAKRLSLQRGEGDRRNRWRNGGLRVEARQKLDEIRPLSIGQAGRISGVSPSDIAVLLIWLSQHEKGE